MIYEKPKNEIFASDAKDGEIVDFPNVKRGWGVTENLGFIPPMEYFNAAFNRVDKSLAYQLQRGIAEWDKDLEYPIGAVVSLNGVVYVAKSQNTNKTPANEAIIWDIVATQKWCEGLFVKKAEIKDSLPTGAYVLYSSNSNIPNGFLRCDGSALDKTTYAALFAVIGYTYGRSGDKFLLPNFSDGKFMRSIGGNAAALGTAQEDAIRNITGKFQTSAEELYSETNPNTKNHRGWGAFQRYDAQGSRPTVTTIGKNLAYDFDASRVVPTANENRPLNMAVVVLIKY
nr:MAG TPA: Baseplate structural protein [Caudoviricetes sp.]